MKSSTSRLNTYFPKLQHSDSHFFKLLLGCGIVIGGAMGCLLYDAYQRRQCPDGMDVLNQVKAYFQDQGPIEGSWMELKPVTINRYGQSQEVYYGGISRKENDKIVQYEFMADTLTGQILTIYPL